MNTVLIPYISRLTKSNHVISCGCYGAPDLGRYFYLIPQFRCYKCFEKFTNDETSRDVPVVYGYCNGCLFSHEPKERDKIFYDLAENRTRAWRLNYHPIGGSICGIIYNRPAGLFPPQSSKTS